MSAILKQKLIDIANGFTKYGLWKGGGSGGSSALSEMTDVTFTNLQPNDILKYNGSVWINDDNLHEYSTEEKIVGKWIDGKPLYEKIIKQTFTFNSQSESLNINIQNIDFVKYYMDFNRIGTYGHNPLNFINPTAPSVNIGGNFTSNNSTFNLRVGTGVVGNTYNVTIIMEYTKTTD